MWKYKNKLLQKVPDGYCGFIYFIVNVGENPNKGKIYVGRKLFTNKTKSKISAREIKATKTRKRVKITVKESNWKQYNSSCQELIDDFNTYGAESFEKSILEFCDDKRCLSYRETWWQFKMNVLEVPSYNGNILGRFFKPKEK